MDISSARAPSGDDLITLLASAEPGLALCGLDPDGQVVSWNAGAERLAGYRAEEILGRSLECLYAPEDLTTGKPRRELSVAAARGRSESEGWSIRKDGSRFWARVAIASLLEPDGRLKGFGILTRDLTVRNNAKLMGESQQRAALAQLAAGLAHDFNNLLTIIGGNASLALANLAPGNPTRALVEEIELATERAFSLTRQLRIFSGRQPAQVTVLDLNAVVIKAVTALRRRCGSRISVVTMLDPSASRVRLDPEQLEQVLLSLVENAREAMPDGGRITIETRNAELDGVAVPGCPPGHYTLLAVSDTGRGMTATTRARLFEPLFTTKAVGHGAGIGLATVQRIVHDSAGGIVVHGEPGIGSSFAVYLPAATGTAATMRPADPKAPGSAQETILLVEDEPGVRRLARLVLEADGYRVLEAVNGEEGARLAATAAGPIHLLLTDLLMPELTGSQLAQRLRQSRPDIKILLMSGDTNRAAVALGASATATAFLQKPFTPEALAERVRRVLDD